jgi:hypothetical protein
MDSNKRLFQATGALYLLAFLAYGGGNALVESVLQTPNYLKNMAAYRMPFITGTILMSLIHSAIITGIGVLLLPILKKHSPNIAYGYWSAILTTSVLLITGTIFLLLQIPLSEEYSTHDSFYVLEALLTKGNFYSYQLGMAVWAMGGLLLCSLLYRTKLVGRWLSSWGLAGYLIFLAGCVLELFDWQAGILLSVPGGLFEVAFAFVLMVKGLQENE